MMTLSKVSEEGRELKINLTGTDKPSKVTYLKLCGLGLAKIDDDLINCLPDLEGLDVSDNSLEHLWFEYSPKLRTLNCCRNNLKDVIFLKQLPNLEELRLSGNPSLTISDWLIAISLCCKLTVLDCRDIRQLVDFKTKYETVIGAQTVALWNNRFAENYSQSLTDVEFSAFRLAFEEAVHSVIWIDKVKYEKFQKFIISKFLTKLIMDLRNKKRELRSSTNNQKLQSPQKSPKKSPFKTEKTKPNEPDSFLPSQPSGKPSRKSPIKKRSEANEEISDEQPLNEIPNMNLRTRNSDRLRYVKSSLGENRNLSPEKKFSISPQKVAMKKFVREVNVKATEDATPTSENIIDANSSPDRELKMKLIRKIDSGRWSRGENTPVKNIVTRSSAKNSLGTPQRKSVERKRRSLTMQDHGTSPRKGMKQVRGEEVGDGDYIYPYADETIAKNHVDNTAESASYLKKLRNTKIVDDQNGIHTPKFTRSKGQVNNDDIDHRVAMTIRQSPRSKLQNRNKNVKVPGSNVHDTNEKLTIDNVSSINVRKGKGVANQKSAGGRVTRNKSNNLSGNEQPVRNAEGNLNEATMCTDSDVEPELMNDRGLREKRVIKNLRNRETEVRRSSRKLPLLSQITKDKQQESNQNTDDDEVASDGDESNFKIENFRRSRKFSGTESGKANVLKQRQGISVNKMGDDEDDEDYEYENNEISEDYDSSENNDISEDYDSSVDEFESERTANRAAARKRYRKRLIGKEKPKYAETSDVEITDEDDIILNLPTPKKQQSSVKKQQSSNFKQRRLAKSEINIPLSESAIKEFLGTSSESSDENESSWHEESELEISEEEEEKDDDASSQTRLTRSRRTRSSANGIDSSTGYKTRRFNSIRIKKMEVMRGCRVSLQQLTVNNIKQKYKLNPFKRRSCGSPRSYIQEKRFKTVARVDETYDASVKAIQKDWDPVHLIRCHSKDNSKDDDTTHVWQCAFEPKVEEDPSWSVATCGGQKVCLIDCYTGRILMRFKHREEDEELFSLAWTTLSLNSKKQINILATAGRHGLIYLIQPEDFVCYAELSGHRDMICTLAFHPEMPTILCSGSTDGLVILWDIGIPSVPKYETVWRKLRTIEMTVDVLSICFVPKFDYVVAGCEDSCWGWPLEKSTPHVVKKPCTNFLHPLQLNRNEMKMGTVVDSIVLISPTIIASKCVGHRCIYLWDFEATISSAKCKNSKNVKNVNIHILANLQWSDNDNFYMNMGFSSENCILSCGDTKGKLWLYHLKQFITSKRRASLSSSSVPPVVVIDWPHCEEESESTSWDKVIVNSITVNSDGKFLVAVTDKNVVCIWS